MNKVTRITILLAGIFFLSLATSHAQHALGKHGETRSYRPSHEQQFETMSADKGIFNDNSIQQPPTQVYTPLSRDVLLDEGFEIWFPAGWSFYQLGVQWLGWQQSAYVPHSGNYCAWHGYFSGGVHNNWMVTPALYQDDEYKLEFWDRLMNYNYYAYSGVHISTGSGDPSSGDFVEIYNANQATPIEWVEHIFDLTPYNGETIYIGFQYSGDNAHTWYVDDVRVVPYSFTDGGVSEIVHPTGTTSGGSVEEVLVNLANYGTSTITEAEIAWTVNDLIQTSFISNSLSLEPTETVELNIGEYDFSAGGNFQIKAWSIIPDDANPVNDTATGQYQVVALGDAGLVGISPEGNSPLLGTKDITVKVHNFGNYVLEGVDIEWAVNEEPQNTYTAMNLNLSPGAETSVTIGTYDFSDPMAYDLLVYSDMPGDMNRDNDTIRTVYATGILWESFENPTWPPDRWTSAYSSPTTFVAYQGLFSCSMIAGGSELGVFSDTLITPLLDIAWGDHLYFYAQQFWGIGMSLHWIDGQTGDWMFIDDLVISGGTGQWVEVDADISIAEGINKLALIGATSAWGDVAIDVVSSDASLHLFDFDMEVNAFNQEELLLTGENIFGCTVRNLSASDVAAGSYTVKLMDASGAELASEAGAALSPMEKLNVDFLLDITEIGQYNYYIEIEYAGDEYLSNNTSGIVTVNYIPEESTLVTVGDGDLLNMNIPITLFGTEFLGDIDMSQTIYLANEIGGPGMMHGMKFYYYNGVSWGITAPMKVALKETTSISNLNNGWDTECEDYLEVCDVVLEFHGGWGEIYIPFDIPYQYLGTNLIVQFLQHDLGFPYPTVAFICTETVSSIKTVVYRDYYELDPCDPPLYDPNLWTQRANTTFMMAPPVEMAVVSGTVYDENSNPIENATISAEGVPFTATTNGAGQYALQPLPLNTYTFKATKLGYEDNSVTLELTNTAGHTLDFNMELKPVVSLSGNVVGSGDPSTGIEDVAAMLYGYNTYEVMSTMNGDFTIEGVFGNAAYWIELSKYGYETYTMSVDVEDINIDLGTITLQELMVSTYNVTAVDSDPDDEAEIFWADPLTGMAETLQYDFGDESYGYANEPFENVWLGNLMPIDEPVTVNTVTLYFIDAMQISGTVTLDLFDGEENLVASSLPFTTQQNSYITVDVLNLTFYDDFYAMLHWRDNPETTHFLGADFSPGVNNYAYIHYPNQGFDLLTDLLGGDAICMLIRANVIMEDGSDGTIEGKSVESYNIYRGVYNDFYNVPNWTLVNANPVSALNYVDLSWLNAEPNTYRYAVEAIYVEGIAEVTFSNVLSIDLVMPSNLDVIPDNSNGSATFTWDSPQHNVQSYKVYLDDMNVPVATGITDLSYEFTGLPSGQFTAGVKAVYNTGSSEINTVEFGITLGFDDYLHRAINIYPNPASEFIMVNNSKNANLMICDLTGRPVMQKTIVNDSQRVDISQLRQGMYLLILSSDEFRINKKLEIFR
nr:carboxypeptidase regulatory-like domain-containing protein [Bacteroidota bacterium]